MRNPKTRFYALALFLAFIAQAHAGRETASFDADWRFFKGDPARAEQPDFNDSAWQCLDVPHDWSIEGPFSETNKTGGAGGFLPSGVAWYRKSFYLPEKAASQQVLIRFDGVMANSDLWINGHHLGHRPYGYVSFCHDLTPYLKFGKRNQNVISVRTDTSAQPASRWYTGSGIYRHVHLIRTDRIHIVPNGVFVWTPDVSSHRATVRIDTTITNATSEPREVTVKSWLIAPDGTRAALAKSTHTLTNATSRTVAAELSIPSPALWDLETPRLYQVKTVVASRGRGLASLWRTGRTLDELLTPFGIRQAQFTPEEGFVMNGRKVLLKGVCLHHDGGAVGAAVPLSLWKRRLTTLRDYGCNAIRTAHNPVAPEFLDLCDRMGFLVMNELFDCWTVGKNPYDYHLSFNEWASIDVRDTVRRDRNHPSVILYSAGNEIHDTPKPELAKRILAELVDVFHANDPTRPVTQGLFRPNVSGDYTNGLADLLDVVGTNYRDQELLDAQRANPDWKIVGTEQRHELSTWLNCRDHQSHSGQFLWTGIDYLGEARHWPRNAFASGLLDRTGRAKPRAFQRQSWWSDDPMVHLVRRVRAEDVLPEDPGYGGEERFTQVTFADWTPKNLEPHTERIEVYSNCEEVELLLNGNSLGTKARMENDAPLRWQVEFEPGFLEAIGRNRETIAARHVVQTAQEAARLELVADQDNVSRRWDDVVVVRATVTDAAGVPVPRAAHLVEFEVEGPGRIVAVDNGDCLSVEPFQASQRKAYAGTCIAIIRGTGNGDIRISATANGLQGASVSLRGTLR